MTVRNVLLSSVRCESCSNPISKGGGQKKGQTNLHSSPLHNITAASMIATSDSSSETAARPGTDSRQRRPSARRTVGAVSRGAWSSAFLPSCLPGWLAGSLPFLSLVVKREGAARHGAAASWSETGGKRRRRRRGGRLAGEERQEEIINYWALIMPRSPQ